MCFAKTVASSELLVDYAALFDTSFLAGEIAQIVKFCATNLTVLVDCDRVDERRFDGEDTLNTDVVADFTLRVPPEITNFPAAKVYIIIYIAKYYLPAFAEYFQKEALILPFYALEGIQ